MSNRLPVAAFCGAALLSVCAGCTTVEAPPPRPPPQVVVSTPVQRDVTNFGEFTGNLRAIESVEVRARVEGFLEQIEFTPSSFVSRGDRLFVIEQEPYRAALARAMADVQGSEAALRRAESDLERLEQAIRTNAVSQQEVTRARAQRDQSRASVLAADAAVTRAEIDLEYTTVLSPIEGVISRNFVDRGNIVGRGETTLLANVYTIDPIHVYFEIPERVLAGFLERSGGLRQLEKETAPSVFVHVDGMEAVFEGRLDYVNPAVDVGSGTVEVRGEVPNPDRRLLPGFFVRVRVPQREEPGALLVAETALSADLGGRYLLVIGENNVVEKRYVELGGLQEDGLRVIRDGIADRERYIVQGLQRARPGLPVNPKDAPAGSSS